MLVRTAPPVGRHALLLRTDRAPRGTATRAEPRHDGTPQPCFSMASAYSLRILSPAAAVQVFTPAFTFARFVRPST